MLDVHPPHTPTHTWRDFLIHIATIVVGLLIAIGLEQAVEAIHHHHQVGEARERIREEMQVNVEIDTRNLHYLDTFVALMDSNIVALRAIETGTRPGKDSLDFSFESQGDYNAAFLNAKDTGVLSMLPYNEASQYADACDQATSSREAKVELSKALVIAHAASRGHTLLELSHEEVQALLTASSIAKEDAVSLKLMRTLSLHEWDAALSGNYRKDIHGASH
jgi:hypothetical protein